MESPIYVNGRALGKINSGIGRYTSEIIKCLGDSVKTLQPKGGNSGIAGHSWEQFTLPSKMSQESLLWSPANSGPLRVANHVLTLHDVSMLEHPEWFAPGFVAWYRFFLPRLVKRVRRIVTVSEFSKGRIVEVLAIPEEKVVVIPNGVDHQVFYPRNPSETETTKAKYGLEGDYVVSVGSLQPRKNLRRLFNAWQQVNIEFVKPELIVLGINHKVFRNRGYGEIPPNVRLLGRVPDIDLPALYGGALACIQPSLYEGFNLPVLEAMACGTPVLASNTSATLELVSDAGMLFDPLDVNEMSEALFNILRDKGVRNTLQRKGLSQAKGFSWEKSAETTLQILKSSL